MNQIKHIVKGIKPLSQHIMTLAKEKEDNLTKPLESLGRLEHIAVTIAGIKGNVTPTLEKKAVFVFAGDHKVVHEEGISSAPIDVTAQMVTNFTNGGAAVNVLADRIGAEVKIVDMGVVKPYENREHVINKFIKPGADNIMRGPAMTYSEAVESVLSGYEVISDYNKKKGLDIFCIGEMGIGNTTPSSAIYSLYTKLQPSEVTGPGAGIDKTILLKKINIIEKSIKKNNPDVSDPIDVLAKVGGLEIGGMLGAIIAGASLGIPIVVDGFIATAAAVLAINLSSNIEKYIFLSHKSAEWGFGHVISLFEKSPILDLGLRLGEGSGALLSMDIICASCDLLNNMATFTEASVIDVKKI